LYDLVSVFESTSNDDTNEKTKSSNNYSFLRRLATHLINHEIQAQADRHILIKRRFHIHRYSTCLEQTNRQTQKARLDYSNRDRQSQKSENSRKIDRIFNFFELWNDTFRTKRRVVCKQTRFISIR
jgi:hypothetical protein